MKFVEAMRVIATLPPRTVFGMVKDYSDEFLERRLIFKDGDNDEEILCVPLRRIRSIIRDHGSRASSLRLSFNELEREWIIKNGIEILSELQAYEVLND